MSETTWIRVTVVISWIITFSSPITEIIRNLTFRMFNFWIKLSSFRITLLIVCPPVQTIYLEIAWKYQASKPQNQASKSMQLKGFSNKILTCLCLVFAFYMKFAIIKSYMVLFLSIELCNVWECEWEFTGISKFNNKIIFIPCFK